MADPKSFFLSPDIHAYLLAHATPLDDVQAGLVERTAELGGVSMMQIAPEQAPFLTLLVRLVGARRAVEVGTFTGLSSLAIAKGLPADGHLLCCDVSAEWTDLARDAWTRAGVADRIDLVISPAAETLAALPTDGEPIDFAFIDADKGGYRTYVDLLLPRMRPGALIVVDNVLWGGRVIDPAADDENAHHIVAFNDWLAADDRVESVVLPVGDGLTLARVR